MVVCFAAATTEFVDGNTAIQGVVGSFFLFSSYFIARSAMAQFWVFMHSLPLVVQVVVSLFQRCWRMSSPRWPCAWRWATRCYVRHEGLGLECRWCNVSVMVAFMGA